MNYIRHLNTFFHYVKHDTNLTAMHVSLYMGLFQVWNSNRFRQPFPVFRDQVMQLSRIGSKNTYHKCLKELHTAGYIQVQPGLSKYMPAKIYMRDFEKHVPPVVQSDLFEAKAVAGGEGHSEGDGEGDSHSEGHCHSEGHSDSHSQGQSQSHSQGQSEDQHDQPSLPTIASDTRPGQLSPSPSAIAFQAIANPAISEPVSVPDSVSNPPKTDTRTVPDMRPLDKPINITKECKATPTVPNQKKSKERKGSLPPGQDQVEAFFREQGHPSTEARKFYLYYQSIGWRVQGGATPITDWKAMAEKWILNDKTYHNNGDSQRNSKTPPNPYYTRTDKDYSEPL